MFEDHHFLRVFHHLKKKWKAIVDKSYELCLYPDPQNSQCYYQHTCRDLCIGNIYKKGCDLVVLEYDWERYESTQELISDKEQIISDMEWNLINSSQELTVDSFLSNSTLSGDMEYGSESDLSFLNLSLPSFDLAVSNKHIKV